jgi:predicted ribosome-associated RNA-binding protein Tma20
VNRTCTIAALTIALLAPLAARSATVDATTLPDGTYTVKVVKVMDPKHLEVTMVDTGALTTLTSGRDSIDFSKVQTDDQLKLSLIKGTVVVFLDLTSH